MESIPYYLRSDLIRALYLIITGTTFPFALTLVELLFDKEKRAEVSGPMVFPPGTFA